MTALDPARRHRTRHPLMSDLDPVSTSTSANRSADVLDRSRPMYLINEDLARAQMRERQREAEIQRRAVRVRVARRLSRRADASSRRARRALAILG